MPVFNSANAKDVAIIRSQWCVAIRREIHAMLPAFRASDSARGREGTSFREFFQLVAHYYVNLREVLARKGWPPTPYMTHRVASAILGSARIALRAEDKWPPAMEIITKYRFEDIMRPIRWILHHMTPKSHRWWVCVIKQAIPPEFTNQPPIAVTTTINPNDRASGSNTNCGRCRTQPQTGAVYRRIHIQRNPFTGKVIRVSYNNSGERFTTAPQCVFPFCQHSSSSLANRTTSFRLMSTKTGPIMKHPDSPDF